MRILSHDILSAHFGNMRAPRIIPSGDHEKSPFGRHLESMLLRLDLLCSR